MKLQILSDLHREGYNFDIPDIQSDLIILAGDIDKGTDGVRWAIDESERLNKPIIYIFGNHEFYNGYYENIIKEALELAKASTKVEVLHNKSFILPDFTSTSPRSGTKIRFLGTTLWSNFRGLGEQHITEAKEQSEVWISDYRKIRYMGKKLTPSDTEKFYMEAVDWIYKELAEPFKGKTVLITHHGPSPQCHNKDRHGQATPLSTYFWSDLEDLIVPDKINLVVYGHTHSNLRFEVNGVPVVCNQRGYHGENYYNSKDFDINYTVIV